MLSVEEGVTLYGKCYLKMLKKHLYVIRVLSCGRKFTIQQYAACCHTANSVINYLNENVPNYIRKENWPPNSCDLNLVDYAIWDMMKEMLYKNVKWYEDTEWLSAAISDFLDRLTKKKSSTIQSMVDAIRKSGRRKRGSHWTSNLMTLTHDSMYISIVIDMLFINRKLDMIKWL